MQLTDLAVNLLAILSVDLAVHVGIRHEQHTDQNARHNTCKEQLADGCAGSHCVHDEGNTGRNDDAKAACHRDDRRGEYLVISHLDKERDRHTSYCRNGCRCGTGNRTIEQTRNDDRAGDAGRPLSKEIGEDVEQPLGNLSSRHQDAGQNKHRHRKERETVDAAYHRTDDIAGACRKGRIKGAGEHRNDSERDRNRNCDHQANNK